MKKNEDIIMMDETEEVTDIIEKKPGFFGYVKDHWVPFLVGTVGVTVLGVMAARLLSGNSGDPDVIEDSDFSDEVIDEEETEI